MTLDEALAAAVDGDTIDLLTDIIYPHTIVIDGKTVTFDLNGHDLNVDTDQSIGLLVEHVGRLFLTEAGVSFNVAGADEGVYIADTGSYAEVSNVTSTIGVSAMSGGEVLVTGDVQGVDYGVYVHGTGTSVTVHGDVTAEVYGAVAGAGKNSILIEGVITAPTYIQVGDEIKDDSEASRRVPTLLPGYFTYSNSSDDNVVYVKAPEPIYGIGVSPATVTFPAKTAGYGAQTPAVITVENTGNQQTGVITIELSGTNAGSFTLSKVSIANIAGGGEDTFTVVPNTGLAAGSYTAAITLTNANVGPSIVNLSFTVNSSGGGGVSSYEYYIITASAGIGGSISPSGSFSVREGRDKIFDISPDTGYIISDVLVDGKSMGAVKTYTFKNVSRAHTIKAQFIEDIPNTDTDEQIPFIDVTVDDWFANSVMWAFEKGLMKGTSDTTFNPQEAITRGMIVTILYRLEGAPSTSTISPFSDVEAGKYYADAVTWAAANGIVSGYGAGLFGPNDSLTR